MRMKVQLATEVLINRRDGGHRAKDGTGGLVDAEDSLCTGGHLTKAPQHEGSAGGLTNAEGSFCAGGHRRRHHNTRHVSAADRLHIKYL
jgi:hypothetical protein